jgi:uncharacterized LabA/DUF88 family protein
MKQENEKIMVFIDNSNLFHSFQKIHFHCDYIKLREVLTAGRKLVDVILYTGIMYPVKTKDKRWLSKLHHLGYSVKTRSVKVAPNGKKVEKRIDVLMAVDIIASVYEKKYDTAVIVSGDGDFVPVVKKLKELNKSVEIWSFKELLSEQLKSLVSTNIHYIDTVLDQIKMK